MRKGECYELSVDAQLELGIHAEMEIAGLGLGLKRSLVVAQWSHFHYLPGSTLFEPYITRANSLCHPLVLPPLSHSKNEPAVRTV